MAKVITIVVNEDGVAQVWNVPADTEVHVCDAVEDTDGVFGEGNNNILSQRV